MIKTRRVRVFLEVVLSKPDRKRPPVKECKRVVKRLIEDAVERYTECREEELVIEEYEYQVLK